MNPAPAPSRPGCLVWLAGCLGLVVAASLTLVLLIIAFYGEEDWRGDRVWADTQAELRATGENLDPASYIPVAVPAAENFGALPFFQVVAVGGTAGAKGMERLVISQILKPVTDHLPFSASSEQRGLPYLGFWLKGDKNDVVTVRSQMRSFLHDQHPQVIVPPNATPAEMFALICPVLADLRAADATHPQCRFDLDYGKPHPWDMSFGPTVELIKVSQVLAYDARLALLSGDAAQALEDFRVAFKIARGVGQEPMLIAGLVSEGIVAIELNVINQGLAEHDWNDAQILALDHDLSGVDVLTATQFNLRGETIRFSLPMLDYYSANRSTWLNREHLLHTITAGKDSWRNLGLDFSYWLLPRGWFEISKAHSVREHLATINLIDAPARRVHPEWEKKVLPGENDIANQWLNFISPGDGPMKNAVKKAAYVQAQINEARVGCRLERYRLVKNTYPASLDILGGNLPRDVMSGSPYLYKLIPDQTYLLYSIGWNQVDDQGDAGDHRTSESPDWIWTNYPNMK